MAMMHEDIAGLVEALIAETSDMTAFAKQPAAMDDPDGLAERLTTVNYPRLKSRACKSPVDQPE